MIVIGINAYHWDSSAALFINGRLIGASEEERFNRIKHWSGFPIETIEWLLTENNLRLSDIDIITIPTSPKENVITKITSLGVKKVINGLARNKKRMSVISTLKSELIRRGNKHLIGPGELPKLQRIEHHISHVYSAFGPSEYNRAAFLTIDAFGDYNSSKSGVISSKGLELLDKTVYPHSVGIFYTALTQFLGFPNVGDEYKVMGLSPYGNAERFLPSVRKLVKYDNGRFILALDYFTHTKDVEMSTQNNYMSLGNIYSPKLTELLGISPRSKSDSLEQIHKDLAKAVQTHLEDIVIVALNDLNERTGQSKLILSGGVAQNSVLNGKILERTPFDEVFISSASHDAGLAVGSAVAFMFNSNLSLDRKSLRNAYTGYCATTAEILNLAESQSYEYIACQNEEALIDQTCNLLLNGGVIGWYQGRAEYGPRALGNRSILVNPARHDAKELINAKIKRRESFRPFAPSILDYAQQEWFESNEESIYMEKVLQVKEEKRDSIPAVVHVDGSGRLQTVKKGINPLYYKLIEKFNEKSGVPILLNTSFNENEPVVNTPKEAYDCFERTDMDALVLHNFIFVKNGKKMA